MNSQPNEWELDKENVQPLRQGRKFASLTAALQPELGNNALKQEQEAFEAELRTYSGDDPLQVWYSYLQWLEQAYPKGGKDSRMAQLMERCLKIFKDEPKYKNDTRYVTTWIKYANVCKEPSEIFNFMHDQGIGSGLTCFYEAWAWTLEQIGNVKRADRVFQEGMKNMAQPIDLMERKYEAFQNRVVRGSTMTEEVHTPQEPEEQRSVLGGLRSVGKHSKVGSNRTGLAKLPTSRGLGLKQGTAANQTGQSFQVFSDENQAPNSLPSGAGEWSQAPKASLLNKENEKKAGVWTNSKEYGAIPKRKTVATPVCALNKPAFNVHIEESADQPMLTPRKPPGVENQVLSARKPEKTQDPLSEVKRMQDNDPLIKPMYCKDQVYCGTVEYSFEELRAARYFTQKKKEEKKRKLEEEEKEIEARREEIKRRQQQLKEESEIMKREQLRLQEEHQEMIEQCRQQMMMQHALFQTERQMQLQRQQELLEQDIQSRLSQLPLTRKTSPQSNAATTTSQHKTTDLQQQELQQKTQSKQSLVIPRTSPQSTSAISQHRHTDQTTSNTDKQDSVFHKRDSTAQKQLLFEDNSKNSHSKQTTTPQLPLVGSQNLSMTGVCPHQAPSLSGEEITQEKSRLLAPCDKSLSDNSSMRQLSCGRQTPESRRSQTAPSPTVTTKEAMQLVIGMFNASLEIEKHIDQTEEMLHQLQQETDHARVSPEPALPSSGMNFVIFDETKDKPPQPTSDGIFVDKENVRDQNSFKPLPSGPGRRGLGEICHASFTKVKATGEKEASSDDPHVFTSMVHHDNTAKENLSVTRTESIESQARDDFTIAPVGSHLSFAAAAHIASTPFCPNSSRGNSAVPSQASDPKQDESINQANTYQEQHTFRDMENENCAKDLKLSPIMEGSNEDSSGHPTTFKDSVFFHHQPMADENISVAPPNDNINNLSVHLIDTSGYIPPDLDEKTEALLSMSIRIDPHNPFDEGTVAEFLKMLQKPLHQYPNYWEFEENIGYIAAECCASIGNDLYSVEKMIGQGGYAKVYKASRLELDNFTDANKSLALKVQSPPNKWEFYICAELQDRLARLREAVDVRSSMISITTGYFFLDASCLITECYSNGSLLDFVNKVKLDEKLKPFPESVAAYFTIELLHIVEKLHKCEIIHGDIKPDNFLFLGVPVLERSNDPEKVFGQSERPLILIDFGQSIDMTKYPPGTTFLSKVNTDGFQCIEMKTDRPWTYQTDLFGLIGTIHVVLFGQYMNVFQQKSTSHWHMTSKICRSWNEPLWKKLFHSLLNIASCDELPDLSEIRQEFEQYFVQSLLPDYIIKQKLINILHLRSEV